MATINLTQLKQEKEAKASSSFENAPTIILNSDGTSTVEAYVAPKTQQTVQRTDTKKVSNAVADARAQMLSPKLKGGNTKKDFDLGYVGEQAWKGTVDTVSNLVSGASNLIDNAGDTADYILDNLSKVSNPIKQVNSIINNANALTGGGYDKAKQVLNENEIIDSLANVGQNLSNKMSNYAKESEYNPENMNTIQRFAGDAARAVGGMIPSIAVGAVGGPTAGMATMASSAFGGSLQKALDDGASYDDAVTYGIASAGVEIATEKLFGGIPFFGKGTLDDIGMQWIIQNIGNKNGRLVVDFFRESFGEGAEELISEYIGEFLTDIYSDAKTEQDIKTRLANTTPNALYSFLLGAASGGVLGAPRLANNIRLGKDIELDTKQAETKIEAKPKETDPMKTMINEDANAEAEKIVAEMGQSKPATDYIAEGLKSDNVMVRYEAQRLNKKATIDSAKKNGVDMKKATKIADYANKVGIRVLYKDLSYTDEKSEKVVRPEGTYQNGVIYISPSTVNPMYQVFKHELTHYIESSDAYQEFQTAIFSLYDDATLNTMRENLRLSRNDIVDEFQNDEVKLAAEIDKELTAILSQDKIFTDKDTIDQLSIGKPNIAQKILRWIKNKLAIARGEMTAEEVKIMETAEELYRKALEQAKKQSFDNSSESKNLIAKTKSGEDVVVVDNPVVSKSKATTKQGRTAVINAIKQYIPLEFKIDSDGRIVNFNKNSASEYTGSVYSQRLLKNAKGLLTNKNLIVGNLGEIIAISKNGKWQQNKKGVHLNDPSIGANGFYHYDTMFAIPVKDVTGNIVNYTVYDADLVLDNNKDGKAYLYDVQNIKKSTSNLDLTSILPANTSGGGALSNNSISNPTNNASKSTGLNADELSVRRKDLMEDAKFSRGLNADLLANPATERNITQKVVGYNRAQSDALNKINGGYARGRTSSIMKQIAAEVVNNGGNYSEELRNELLDEIWNTAYTVDDANLDVYTGVRDYFKNVKMKLTDSAKAEISDYNSWRKSVSNRLHFTKDGRSIDDVYQELQSLYGEVFPEVNSEGEMLEVMADVYDYEKSKRVHLSELGVKKEDFAKDFDDILEEFKNNILYRSNKKFLDAVARKSLQKSKADMAQRALQAFGDVSDDVKALLEEHESSEGYRTSEDWSTLVPQIKSYGALSKTLSQVLDVVANSNPEVRARLYNAIEKPLYEAKKTYTTRTRKNVSKVYDEVVSKYKIKKGSKESEALMWYGEKTKSLWNKKQGKLETMPYSLDDLKKDMPNTWQNIVEADKVMRQIYDDYVDSLNDVLSVIYPNIEIKAKYELNKLKANVADLVEQKKQLEDMDLVHAKPETLALYSQVLKDLKASKSKMSKITNDINSGDYYANKRVNKRSDYYHHFYELTASDTLQDIFDMNASNNISNALAGKSEFTKPKSKFAGFMQHRGMGKYEADAIASILDYIPKAEYKIAFDPVITEYRDIISNIVKESGEEYDNTEFINWFTNYTNDLAGKTNPIDRVISNAHNGRKYMKALRSLNNFVKGKTIVGNLASATSQFFNMPNGVALLKHRGGLSAVKDLTLGQKDYLQYIGNKVLRKSDSSPINDSVFLSERYLDGIYSKFDSGILDNVNKMRTWLLQVGDQAVSENLWFSAYEQALRLGKSNPIEYADNLVRDAVAGRGVGEIPLTQKSELVKLLAPFQVEVNNTWNLIKSLSGVQLEGSGVKELAKNLLGGDERDYIALLTMFVITYFMNNLKEEITGNRTGMDLVDAMVDTYEKMDKEENASTGDWIASAAGRVGGEFLSNMPGGNWWTTAAGLTGYDAEAFFGEADPSRFGTGVTGVQAVVDPLMQFAVGKNVDWQSILTNLTPIGDKQTNRMYKMAEDAGLIPRIDWNRNDGLIINGNVVGKDQEGKKVPFNEIKWEEFFKDIKKGSYNDNNGLKYPIDTSDPINMAKGFAFGTYATKEGKEYINEGYSALSKQTTEKYEDLVKNSAKNYADAKTYYDYFRQKEDNSYSNAELLNQKAMQDAIKQIIEKGPIETDENGVVTSKYEYSDFGTTEKAMKAYAGAIAKGIDFNIVKEASKIKSVQKQDGARDSKAITNSAAALVRKFYEEKGIYQKIVDYCNSSKDTDVTAFGLSAKVLDDATYKNILSEIAKVKKGK